MAERVETTERGFQIVNFRDRNGESCSLQQSSAIDISAPDGLENAGSSFVWLGCDKNASPYMGHGMSPRMHLDREHVRMLIGHLQHWLETGDLGGNHRGGVWWWRG
jgi:hypothetical protein